MRQRASVKIAVLAATVVVGGGLWSGASSLVQHRRDTASASDLAAATDITSRVAVPSGLSACHDEQMGTYVCWRGQLSPPESAVALARGLRSAGATTVGAKCVLHRRLGPMCRVTATLGTSEWGQFEALIGPDNIDRLQGHPDVAAQGSYVQGDSMLGNPGLPAYGAPIELPPL